MSRRMLQTILISAVFIFCAAQVFAQVPSSLIYQGRLTNAAGAPITATTNVTINIYSAASGGSPLYTSGVLAVTPDASGVFTVELPSVPAVTFDGNPKYVGITVGGDTEMTPRQLLASAPYAYNANVANTANSATTSGTATSVIDNAITSAKIADGAVASADILDGTVATADIAANAVTNDKISGETGGASFSEGGTNTTLTNLNTIYILASRTINLPAAGYVLAIGTCQPMVSHVNGTPSSIQFGVSASASAFPSNQDINIILPTALPTGTYYWPVTAQTAFNLSAGANTIYLLGNKLGGGGTVQVADKQLTLLYFPTAYGTVDPPLVSGNGSSEEDGVDK